MASFNKIILMGNLVADPELKQTPNGVSVCSFSIAVSRKFTRQGEQPQTDFFNITCWRATAEFVAKYFSKGKSILICGEMHQRSWTDQTGAKRYTYEVVADDVTFAERKSGESPIANEQPRNEVPQFGGGSVGGFDELSTDDELPF